MLLSFNALHSPISVGGVGIIPPFPRLHTLSVQRVFALLCPDLPDAKFSLSVLALPLGHPLILRSSFPFSVRWRHDLKVFLYACVQSPPVLHPFFLLQEPLTFGRWIMKSKTHP